MLQPLHIHNLCLFYRLDMQNLYVLHHHAIFDSDLHFWDTLSILHIYNFYRILYDGRPIGRYGGAGWDVEFR